MMANRNEKETAVMANQMMLLIVIEELSQKSNAEKTALLRVATFKQKLDERHILCQDKKVLDKYYDLLDSLENKPSFWSKLKYNINIIKRRVSIWRNNLCQIMKKI